MCCVTPSRSERSVVPGLCGVGSGTPEGTDLPEVRPEVALAQMEGWRELYSGKTQVLIGTKASLNVFCC